MSKEFTILVVLVIYNVGMLAIGMIAARWAKSKEAFIGGENRLGGLLGAFAYVSSNSSAWILVGYTGFVYLAGLQAIWLALGLVTGFWACWAFAGPVLAREGREKGHLTLIDFLSVTASGPTGRAIRSLAAVLVIFCFSFYIASQFQAAGQSFEKSLHIDPLLGLGIGALIVFSYTALGGFWAVAATDAFQGAIMAFVAMFLPVAAIIAAGGPSEVWATISADPDYVDLFGGARGWNALAIVAGGVGLGLASLGQPHNLNWIIALRDEKARRGGTIASVLWGIAVYGGMGAAALAARALYGPPASGTHEDILFVLSEALGHPVVQGVVVAAVLAAIMSTVDSQLLVTSAALAHDLGLGRKRGGVSGVWLVRAALAAVAIAAIGLALFLPASVFRRVLFAWSALGAAFGPIVVCRVLGVRSRDLAVLAAMASGFLGTVWMNARPDLPGDVGEYLLPWIPPLALLLAFQVRREAA